MHEQIYSFRNVVAQGIPWTKLLANNEVVRNVLTKQELTNTTKIMQVIY